MKKPLLLSINNNKRLFGETHIAITRVLLLPRRQSSTKITKVTNQNKYQTVGSTKIEKRRLTKK